MQPKYLPNDKVKYRDGDPLTYIVYANYPNGMVSLALHDYPDTEADYQVSETELKPA